MKRFAAVDLLRLARFIRHGDAADNLAGGRVKDNLADVREKGQLARQLFEAYADDIRAQAASGDRCALRLVITADRLEDDQAVNDE